MPNLSCGPIETSDNYFKKFEKQTKKDKKVGIKVVQNKWFYEEFF